MSASAITGLDHVVIAVGDLDRAAQIYRRLGFTLSPRGLHSPSMGTANHTIMLGQDYFELVTVIAPTEHNRRWREFIAKGDGIAATALATQDADATRSHWMAAAFSVGDVIPFSRPVERPDRESMEARFEVAILREDALPGLGLFACRHHTPEAVWLPELTRHPNTAVAVRTVTLASPDPRGAAERARNILGAGDLRESADGGMVLSLGPHTLSFVASSSAPLAGGGPGSQQVVARAVGMDVAVESLEVCREVIAHSLPSIVVAQGHLRIPAVDACGVDLTFTEGSA